VRKWTLSRLVKNAIKPPNPVESPAIKVSINANKMLSVVIIFSLDCLCLSTCKDNTNYLKFNIG
jgi:hypothetical protein